MEETHKPKFKQWGGKMSNDQDDFQKSLEEQKKRIEGIQKEKKVSLRNVYQVLGLDPTQFNRWAEIQIKLLDIEVEKVSTHTGGRPMNDYLISEKDRNRIVTHSKSELGNEVRDKLVDQNEMVQQLKQKYDPNFFKSFLDDPQNMSNLALALVEKSQELGQQVKTLEVALENKASVKELRANIVSLVNSVASKKGMAHSKVYIEGYKGMFAMSPGVTWKDEFWCLDSNKIAYLEKKGRQYLERLNVAIGGMLNG